MRKKCHVLKSFKPLADLVIKGTMNWRLDSLTENAGCRSSYRGLKPDGNMMVAGWKTELIFAKACSSAFG